MHRKLNCWAPNNTTQHVPCFMILLILSFLFVPSLISHRSCFGLGNAPTQIAVSRRTDIVDDLCAAVSNSRDPIHDTYDPDRTDPNPLGSATQ